MSRVKKLEQHFSSIFRERFVLPQFELTSIYGKTYLGTFYPKTTQEVQAIVQYCNTHKIYISQKQQEDKEIVDVDFVILSFSKMNTIEILEEDRIAIVDVGVETSELMGFIEFKKFTLPCFSQTKRTHILDVLNHFSINQQNIYASSPLSSLVLWVEGVLGNGEIVQFGSSAYQPAFGEFLKQMMLNTYGQYGIITKVKLKLLPLVTAKGIFTIEAYNLETGTKYLHKLSRLGIKIDDFYFFERASIQKLSDYKKLQLSTGDAPYVFLIYVSDSSMEDVEKTMDKIQMQLTEVLEGTVSIEKTQLAEEVERRLSWKDEVQLASLLGSYHQRLEKFCISPSKISYFISDLDYIKKDFGVEFLITGSLQDGVIDVHIMNIQDETGLTWGTFQYEIRAKILDVLYVYKGRPMTYYEEEQETIERYFMGESGYHLTHNIKQMCDPNGILIPTHRF